MSGGAATGPAAERARDRARTLYDECVATQRMAVKVLDRLESMLTPVLDSPAARRAASAAAGSSSPASVAQHGGFSWRVVKKRLRRAGVIPLVAEQLDQRLGQKPQGPAVYGQGLRDHLAPALGVRLRQPTGQARQGCAALGEWVGLVRLHLGSFRNKQGTQ